MLLFLLFFFLFLFLGASCLLFFFFGFFFLKLPRTLVRRRLWLLSDEADARFIAGPRYTAENDIIVNFADFICDFQGALQSLWAPWCPDLNEYILVVFVTLTETDADISTARSWLGKKVGRIVFSYLVNLVHLASIFQVEVSAGVAQRLKALQISWRLRQLDLQSIARSWRHLCTCVDRSALHDFFHERGEIVTPVALGFLY